MVPKENLLKLATKEYATTLKMMRAFPDDKKDFKPHDRSSDAVKLMSTFVFEMYLSSSYVFGDALDRSKFKDYKPANLEVIIADFERESSENIKRLQQLPEQNLAKIVEFAGTKFSTDEFMLMMICDQIHHRGQLSVYVRMAGGQVPSIYGPSADDSSTNL